MKFIINNTEWDISSDLPLIILRFVTRFQQLNNTLLKFFALFLLAVSGCSQNSGRENSTLKSDLQADIVKPTLFSTDGCSLFPDGTMKNRNLWNACCVIHDVAYWKGGTHKQRLTADLALKECVSQKGKKKTAALMYLGVRAGGHPTLPTPFRWGFGWPKGRGYKPLSQDELYLIEQSYPPPLPIETTDNPLTDNP